MRRRSMPCGSKIFPREIMEPAQVLRRSLLDIHRDFACPTRSSGKPGAAAPALASSAEYLSWWEWKLRRSGLAFLGPTAPDASWLPEGAEVVRKRCLRFRVRRRAPRGTTADSSTVAHHVRRYQARRTTRCHASAIIHTDAHCPFRPAGSNSPIYATPSASR